MFLCFHPQPNSSVTALYHKGPQAASRTNPAPDEGTLVSPGGWFIDKGRGPATKPVFIDLSKDESVDTESNVSESRRPEGSPGGLGTQGAQGQSVSCL